MTQTAPRPFVFVLMPFDLAFNDIYKFGIKETVVEAGRHVLPVCWWKGEKPVWRWGNKKQGHPGHWPCENWSQYDNSTCSS